jgi:hypothetical protein
VRAARHKSSPQPFDVYASPIAGTEFEKVEYGVVVFAAEYVSRAWRSSNAAYVAFAMDGEVGGDDVEVVLKVNPGV